MKLILVFASAGHYIENHYSRSVTIQLDTPTNDTRLVIAKVCKAIHETINKAGVPFARAGLIEIKSEKLEQIDAFNPSLCSVSRNLMRVIDIINTLHCPIVFASQCIDQTWAIQRNIKSSSHTTKPNEIPIVILL